MGQVAAYAVCSSTYIIVTVKQFEVSHVNSYRPIFQNFLCNMYYIIAFLLLRFTIYIQESIISSSYVDKVQVGNLH